MLQKLETFLQYLHNLWIGPLMLVEISCLTYWEVGPSALIGSAVLIAVACCNGNIYILNCFTSIIQCILFQAILSHALGGMRVKTARRTDVRIGIMNEIVNGIKVIKLNGWEFAFADKIAEARK